MSLTAFREHCAKMAVAEHKPECPSLPKNRPHWSAWSPVCGGDGFVEALRWNGPPPPAPTCEGCNSAEDRALFARLADEVDDYRQTDLFGDVTVEPTATETSAAAGPTKAAMAGDE